MAGHLRGLYNANRIDKFRPTDFSGLVQWRNPYDLTALTLVPAAEFVSASSKSLTTPDAADLDGATSMTWEFFKNDYAQTAGLGFLGKFQAGVANQKSWIIESGPSANQQNHLMLRIPDASVAAAASDSGLSQAIVPDAETVASAVWSHVFIYYDGAGATNADKVRIFLDGVEQTPVFSGNNFPTSIANGQRQMSVGRGYESGSSSFCNCALSRVRITKNRTFTEQQLTDHVASMYNSGAGKFHADLTAGEKTGLVVSLDLTETNGTYVDQSSSPHTFTNNNSVLPAYVNTARYDRPSGLTYSSVFTRCPRYLTAGGPNGTPCWDYPATINLKGTGDIATFSDDAWPPVNTSGDILFTYNHVQNHSYSENLLLDSSTDATDDTYCGVFSVREGATNNYRMSWRVRDPGASLNTQVQFSNVLTPNTWHAHFFKKAVGTDIALRIDGVADTYSGSPSTEAKASWYNTVTPRNNSSTGILRRSDGDTINNASYRVGELVQYGPALTTARGLHVERWLRKRAGL